MHKSFSIIFTVAALISLLNKKWLKLPTTIGQLILGLSLSALLFVLQPIFPTVHLANPDFAKYAEGCGALVIRVTEKTVFHDTIQKLLDHDGPALMEVVTDVKLI